MGQYLVAPDPSTDQVNSCWGIPVVTTVQNPPGQGLLVDTSKFGRMAIRSALSLRTGFANDDFVKNLLRWISEERLCLCVERPAAVLKITNFPAAALAEARTKAKSSTK